MDLTGFNLSEIEPETSFEPLPADWYKAVITYTEEKPTKSMTGTYLQLNIEVIEGQYAGRKVFDRLNLKNPNSVAMQIAQSRLSSIARAVGVDKPQDSIELRDIPLMIKLAVKPADGQYSASNEIKGYAATKGAAPAAAVAAVNTSTPPWKR